MGEAMPNRHDIQGSLLTVLGVTHCAGHTLVLTQAATSDACHVLWSLYHDATASAASPFHLQAM